MARDRDVEPGAQGEEVEAKSRRRERSPARIVAMLVVIAVVVAFVVQNHENVAVKFWFVTGHVHLVWLMLICVVLGAAAELLIRRAVRQRVRSRFKKLRRHEP